MWEVARSNRRKSFFLAVFMWFLLLSIGFIAGELVLGPGGGPGGLTIALIVWLIMLWVAYRKGKNIILAISRAHKINKSDHPRLFNVVEEMVLASQLPAMPEIYIIDDSAPNAFATGIKPEKAAIAVTTGLLNILNRDQLQGVIAHEIGHIKNRDVQFMTTLGVMLGAIVIISDLAARSLFWGGGGRRRTSSGGGQIELILFIVGLIVMILAPVLAQLIYLASSRKREYLADASSAIFTRFPTGLAEALEKITVSPVKMRKISKVTAPMYIINPIMKLNSNALFSTHPPVNLRVKVLRSMAGGAGFMNYNAAFQAVTNTTTELLPASALKIPGQSFRETTDEVQEKMQPKAAGIIAAAALAVIHDDLETGGSEFEARVRESTDAIWKSKNYKFIQCPCGAILKIPPELQTNKITCLRCSRIH